MSAQDNNTIPFQDINYNPDAVEVDARESYLSSLEAVENNHHLQELANAGRMVGAGGQMLFGNNNPTNVLLDGLHPSVMASQHTSLPSAAARYLMSQQQQLQSGGGVLPMFRQNSISQHLQPGHGLPLHISPAMMTANQTPLNYPSYMQAPHSLGNSFSSSLATAQTPHPGVVSSFFNDRLDTYSTASRDLNLSNGTSLLDPTAIHSSMGGVGAGAGVGRGLLGGSTTADVLLQNSHKQAAPRRRPPVKRTKKPKDCPRRPLSAYNLFFRDERKRILASIPGSSSCREEELDKATDPSSSKKRAPHGKVSFENLAKMIGARWKEVADEPLQHYKDLSAKDHERYTKEMKKYDEKLEALKAEEEKQIAATKQQNAAAREEMSQKEQDEENEVSSRTSTCGDSASSLLTPRDVLEQDNRDAIATSRVPLEHSNKRKRIFSEESEEYLSPHYQVANMSNYMPHSSQHHQPFQNPYNSELGRKNDTNMTLRNPYMGTQQGFDFHKDGSLVEEHLDVSRRAQEILNRNMLIQTPSYNPPDVFESNSGRSMTRTDQVLSTLAAAKDHHRRVAMDDLYRGLLANDERKLRHNRLADAAACMGMGGGSAAPGTNTQRNLQEYLQERERFVAGDTTSLRNDKYNG